MFALFRVGCPLKSGWTFAFCTSAVFLGNGRGGRFEEANVLGVQAQLKVELASAVLEGVQELTGPRSQKGRRERV